MRKARGKKPKKKEAKKPKGANAPVISFASFTKEQQLRKGSKK